MARGLLDLLKQIVELAHFHHVLGLTAQCLHRQKRGPCLGLVGLSCRVSQTGLPLPWSLPSRSPDAPGRRELRLFVRWRLPRRRKKDEHKEELFPSKVRSGGRDVGGPLGCGWSWGGPKRSSSNLEIEDRKIWMDLVPKERSMSVVIL